MPPPSVSPGAEAALFLAGDAHGSTTDEASMLAPNTVSQMKIVVTVAKKLNWLNLLVLDCFWRVTL